MIRLTIISKLEPYLMDTFSRKNAKILFWKTWPHMKYKWSIERHKQRNMIFDDTMIDKAAQSCNNLDYAWIITLFEKNSWNLWIRLHIGFSTRNSLVHSFAAKNILVVTFTTSFDSLSSVISLSNPTFQYFSSSFFAFSFVAKR